MRASAALIRLAILAIGTSVFIGHAAPLGAQYLDHAGLSSQLRELSTQGSNTQLVTIATTPGGRAVQALRVGPAGRPALLVVAGAHGPHLIGSAVALDAARSMINAGQGNGTIWFIPRLNPDAAEAMFGSLKWERTANSSAGDDDDDNDQASDEDPVDDLDGNGAITSMRIADPDGAWLPDSLEPRLLRRANAARGEVGQYSIESEGRDNDRDERWNEDGPGGTNVNLNFSYDYPHHGAEAGRDPFAAPEARGLAEFLMAHPEIAAIYVVGPQDNVLKPWENRANQGIMREDGTRAPEGSSAGGPLRSIMRQDQQIFASIANRFQEVTGLEKGPASESLGGDVLSWAYYHFGRWAVGSRAWWVPEAPRDTSERRPASGGSSGGSSTDQLAEQRGALKWFESQGIVAYVPWTAVPELEGAAGKVEVGGWLPGALLNPPAGAELDSTLARQGRFISELAGMLPSIELPESVVTDLGGGVWRIEARVVNAGALPSHTALAARLRQPQRVRLDLELGNATLLSGEKTQLLGALEGGGRSTLISWTVAAPAGSSLELTAGSPVTGSATQTITLR